MECLKVIVFSFFFLSSLNAQSEEEDWKYKEVGVGFNFINNFIPSDIDIGTVAPFQFYFNSWDDEEVRRIAVGLDIQGSIETDDEDRTVSNNGFGIDFSTGLGKSKAITEKLKFIGGGDYLLGVDYNSIGVSDDNNSQFDNKRSTYIVETGGGIFAGLQYSFTERLSLYTEMSYIFVIDYTGTNLKFDSGGRDNEKETKFSYGTRYHAPSYLVLFYKF